MRQKPASPLEGKKIDKPNGKWSCVFMASNKKARMFHHSEKPKR